MPSSIRVNLEGTELAPQVKRMVTEIAKAKTELADATDAYNEDPVVIRYQEAQTKLKIARDRLYDWMVENRVTQVKHAGLTCFETTRHDYQIKNEGRFKRALEEMGILQGFITWDMPKIKQMASRHRKESGEDFPGIESIAKSFLEVR